MALTKTVRVLTFEGEFAMPNRVTFRQVDDDTRLMTTVLSVLTTDWEQMGRPQTLTVTIEPGDLLNRG